MTKLHEILAVDGDKEGIFKKILNETQVVFQKQRNLFEEHHKKYVPQDENENAEGLEEHHSMETTVHDRLRYNNKACIDYFDVVLQKEKTNTKAKADLTVDGVTILKDVPATFLLGLENKLKLVRPVFEAIPTLPSGHTWEGDDQKGAGIYRLADPEKKFRTAKTFQHKVLYEATKEHPAQIERWEETKNVGIFITERWSGMLTSAKKAMLLQRIDKLIQATKKARQRANCEEVEDAKIGKEIFTYIMDV